MKEALLKIYIEMKNTKEGKTHKHTFGRKGFQKIENVDKGKSKDRHTQIYTDWLKESVTQTNKRTHINRTINIQT